MYSSGCSVFGSGTAVRANGGPHNAGYSRDGHFVNKWSKQVITMKPTRNVFQQGGLAGQDGTNKYLRRTYIFAPILFGFAFVAPAAAFGAEAQQVLASGAPPRHAAKKSAARTALTSAPQNNENITITTARRAHGTMIVLGTAQLRAAVPGTNPLKVLAQNPGIMYQSADPQGLDTWSSQLYMHGFMQNQISTTLDDIPLGELVFRNYNGLNPIEAVTSENVSRIDVSTGAGAESVASTNNLGGSLEYQSSNPKSSRGGQIDQTFGSYNMYHTFIRLDSGELNPSGTKFYVSYMRNDTDKWKGYGQQFTQQVNMKFLQPVNSDSSVTAYFDWSDLHEYMYQDYSLDMWRNAGPNIDYYYNGRYSSYVTALNAAKGIFPSYLNGVSDKEDASYYDGAVNINDYFGYLKGDFALSDALRWKTSIYGHSQDTSTTYASPYAPSPSGAPIFEQVKEPSISRYGILSSLQYRIAHHNIEAGVWYENSQFVSTMFGYNQPAEGEGMPLSSVGNFSKLTPFMKMFGQTSNTNTFQAFVQDTYNILPNLALHFGFKSLLNTSRAGDGYYDTAYYGNGEMAHGSLTTGRAFLPHISGDWHFSAHHELYFDIAKNVHAYPLAQYKTAASPFAITQAAYQLTLPTLKPESDWAYAVGYRYSRREIDANIHAYRVNFFNRLQQINSCVSVTACSVLNPVSTVMNMGGITMNGVDAGLTLRPLPGLSFYNSVSYNHSTYDQNVNQLGTVYHTRGKQVVAYPRFMYKTSLSYAWRALDAHIDASFTSRRNLSYTGDAKIPAYWIANFGMRYRLGDLGRYRKSLHTFKNVDLSFNIYNLTNVVYVSTMGENGFPLSGDYQSFMFGAPRSFFGTLRAEF